MHATLASLVFPTLLLVAGLAAGLVVRLLLTKRLERVRDDSPGAKHLLLNVARGSAVLWFATLGLYLAAEAADLPPRISRVVGHVLLVMLTASITWMISRIAGGLVRSRASLGALPSATVMTNLGYDADLDHVERQAADIAREVMSDVDGGVPAAEPVIRFQKLGVATIQFTAELTARDASSLDEVKHEFIKRLLRRFRAEGIELPGGASDEARAERVSLAVAEHQGIT